VFLPRETQTFRKMHRPDTPRSYPWSHYDDQMCLKPPLLLWVGVLYLSRAITLPIAMAMGHFAGVEPNAIERFRGLWSVDALFPSVIAAVVLYTMFRRVPTASKPVRWIWLHGRSFLLISAVLDVVLLSITPIREGGINDGSLLALFAAAVDLYFLAYVLAARRVRDAFAEFPAPLDSTR
jgi:hypothetical protein